MPSKTPQLPEPNYYIYFIELTDSGHFYVGLTENAPRREEEHYKCIIQLLLGKKYHDSWENWCRKKKKTEYKPTIGQKVHWFFALKLLPKVNHFATPGRTIQRHYTFTVKHRCYTLEEAKTLESLYLACSKGNKLCLNVQMVSRYNKRKIIVI